MAHRKPTKILKLQGVAKNHPERIKEREKTEPECTEPLANPPAYLSELELAIWQELSGHIVNGVLTAMDSFIFEVTVRLMYKFRTDNIKTGELSQLTRNLSLMGLTPADRSRVVVPKKANKPTGWGDA